MPPVEVSSRGESDISRSFGAEVEVNDGGVGLYLVVGYKEARTGSIVTSAGGKVIFELPESKVLAIIPRAAHPLVEGNREIAVAGPVSIDPLRFSQFLKLLGYDESITDLVARGHR